MKYGPLILSCTFGSTPVINGDKSVNVSPSADHEYSTLFGRKIQLPTAAMYVEPISETAVIFPRSITTSISVPSNPCHWPSLKSPLPLMPLIRTDEEYCHERLGEAFAEALSGYDTSRRVRVLIDDFLTDGMVRGRRILDVGCGLGFFSERLVQRGAHVVACDIGFTFV